MEAYYKLNEELEKLNHNVKALEKEGKKLVEALQETNDAVTYRKLYYQTVGKLESLIDRVVEINCNVELGSDDEIKGATPMLDIPHLPELQTRVTYRMVYLEGENPWDFWLIHANNAALDALQSEMQQLMADDLLEPVRHIKPIPGDYVCYQEGKLIRRAVVTHNLQSDRLKILDVDSSDVKVIKQQNLFNISFEISLVHARAMNCFLVETCDDTNLWTAALQKLFAGVLKCCTLDVDVLESRSGIPPSFLVDIRATKKDECESKSGSKTVSIREWVCDRILPELRGNAANFENKELSISALEAFHDVDEELCNGGSTILIDGARSSVNSDKSLLNKVSDESTENDCNVLSDIGSVIKDELSSGKIVPTQNEATSQGESVHIVKEQNEDMKLPHKCVADYLIRTINEKQTDNISNNGDNDSQPSSLSSPHSLVNEFDKFSNYIYSMSSVGSVKSETCSKDSNNVVYSTLCSEVPSNDNVNNSQTFDIIVKDFMYNDENGSIKSGSNKTDTNKLSVQNKSDYRKIDKVGDLSEPELVDGYSNLSNDSNKQVEIPSHKKCKSPAQDQQPSFHSGTTVSSHHLAGKPLRKQWNNTQNPHSGYYNETHPAKPVNQLISYQNMQNFNGQSSGMIGPVPQTHYYHVPSAYSNVQWSNGGALDMNELYKSSGHIIPFINMKVPNTSVPIITEISSDVNSSKHFSQTDTGNVELKPQISLIKPKEELDAMISCIVSPDEIYVHLANENNMNIDKMQSEMRDYYSLTEFTNIGNVESAKCFLGRFCAVYCRLISNYEKDGIKWYRAEVLEWNSIDDVLVFLVDHGNKVHVKLNQLQPLAKQFSKYYIMAQRCHLSGVKYDGDWPSSVCTYLKDLLSINEAYSLTVVPSETKNIKNSLEVVLYEVESTSKSSSINSRVIEFLKMRNEDTSVNMEEWNPMVEDFESERNNYRTDIDDPCVAVSGYKPKDDERICKNFQRSGFCAKKTCKLEHVKVDPEIFTTDTEEVYQEAFQKLKLPSKGSSLIVHVTAVISPNAFYVQIKNHAVNRNIDHDYDDEPETLATLTKYINKSGTIESFQHLSSAPTIGQIVLAEAEGHFWRARVNSIVDNNVCMVFYVDFGTEERVKIKKIREMQPRFLHLPFQAVECSMANVEFTGEDTADKALNQLSELVEGKKLHGVVSESLQGLLKLELILHDENQNDIGEQLAKSGYYTLIEKEKEEVSEEGYRYPG